MASEVKDKNELMVVALTQRIGELTMQYENVIASLRAEVTILSRVADIAAGHIEEKK